jgi:hypothetical protein
MGLKLLDLGRVTSPVSESAEHGGPISNRTSSQRLDKEMTSMPTQPIGDQGRQAGRFTHPVDGGWDETNIRLPVRNRHRPPMPVPRPLPAPNSNPVGPAHSPGDDHEQVRHHAPLARPPGGVPDAPPGLPAREGSTATRRQPVTAGDLGDGDDNDDFAPPFDVPNAIGAQELGDNDARGVNVTDDRRSQEPQARALPPRHVPRDVNPYEMLRVPVDTGNTTRTMIHQGELAEFMRLQAQSRELRRRLQQERDRLRQLVETGAPVERGPLTIEVRESVFRRVTKALIVEVLGEDVYDDLQDMAEPRVTRRLVIRENRRQVQSSVHDRRRVAPRRLTARGREQGDPILRRFFPDA